MSSHHNYRFPDPTPAIKEKLTTNKTELLNLRREVKTREEAIRIDTKAFEHAKSELNKAGARLVEETASLVAAKGAHDTLVEEIQSQNNYLEEIRGAKSLQQEQQTWEQSLIKENRKLKEEVKSLRKLLEDNLNHYNREAEIVKKDIDVLKFEHQRRELFWENQNRNKDLEAKEHVAAAVKEAVEKALSCKSAEFDTVGLEVRTTFLESHRVRDPKVFAPTQALCPYESKSTHDFNVIADMTLYLDPQIPGYRTDGETFTRIYGIRWTTAERFKCFPQFVDLVNKYALAKCHCPQTFESTTFFKVWSRMGVCFDEADFEEVAAWMKNARQTFKTTVNLNLALAEIEKTHNIDSTQTYDKVARRHESDRIILQEILKKKEFCATLRALPRQAGIAIRSRHFEWLKSPQGRVITIIEKGSEVAHYADALLDAVMFVPELFDNKCETSHDDELYKQTYHHSPVEIISMASCDHSKSLINVINWFARIKQWCTNRDYLRTDFVTESGQLGIYPFASQKHDWLKLPKWDSILRDLESLYLKEENMNKRKHQRVDQPTFLEVGQIQVDGQELSSKDTNSAESPVKNRSPAEESSKPGMSRSQYFKDQFDTPPSTSSGLPLQPISTDWNEFISVSRVKSSSDGVQKKLDDGWGSWTETTKESSLENMRGASPATLPVPHHNSMREGFSRTIGAWGGRTARGGRATRGSRGRGSRNSFKVNIASSEAPGTGTIASRNILPQNNFLEWNASKNQGSDENRISSWGVSDIPGSEWP
ncbi:hypothetical protein BOTCAL_0052g00210 [Botryotinia calthae]|uniref:Uncharacterized protein n=1 Tax=Botryotinia calthae TaxID=38488 RepID=A0A4Y8DB87_9HELO|nr:hypothetical protein BOTCAL_0052g00210 [Botryotinia calthae]